MNEDKALKLFEPYENILFDFGGIFIDLDYQRSIDAFARLGAEVDINSPLFLQLETGKITAAQFLSELKKIPGLSHTSDSDLIRAWGAMLGPVRAERVKFLRELARKKNIFMLSNINQIHQDQMAEYLSAPANAAISDFYSLFDRIYFSHQIGLRKPNLEVFEHVMADAKLDRKTTLFMDDSLQHIEGARKFGLDAYHLPANTFIVS